MDLNSLINPEIARSRRPDEIDLVEAVHEKLATNASGWSGLPTWKDEPEIVMAKDASPLLARILITRNLRSRFCALPPQFDARFERLLLSEECDLPQYLENIETVIAPSLEKVSPAQKQESGAA